MLKHPAIFRHRETVGRSALAVAVCLLVMGLIGVGPAMGQYGPRPAPPSPIGENPPPPEVEGVGVDADVIGNQVPLDLTFTDSTGKQVTLADYARGDLPILLNLGYYNCPMLCGLILEQITKTARRIDKTPGQHYRIVTVSFDPAETTEHAAKTKSQTFINLNKAGAADGWAFLTADQATIDRLTEAVGFSFNPVKGGEFAHSDALVLLSPDGVVNRHLQGLTLNPQKLNLSIVEASEGKVGSALDLALLFCFQYDAMTGRYTRDAMNLMRLAGAFTVLMLITVIGTALFLEFRGRRRRQHDHPNPPSSGFPHPS